MKATTQFRKLLKEEKCVHLGPSWDCVSATLAKEAGFKALHISGTCMVGAIIGSPDMGLITMTEVIDHVSRMCSAVDIPFICDAEAGWGNVINVDRAVKLMEKAGIAGIHLEDQTTPKKCPVMDGRVILPRGEAIGKIKAALAARTDPDFVIIARCDADEISFDELVTRMNLYLEAGADMVMMSGLNIINGVRLTTLPVEEQLKWFARLPKEVNGPILGLNYPPGTTIKTFADMGYKAYLSPVDTFFVGITAMREALQEVVKTGICDEYMSKHHPGVKMTGPWLTDMWNQWGWQRYIGMEKDFKAEIEKPY